VTRLFSDDALLDAQPLRIAGVAGSGGSDVHPEPGDPLLLHAVLGPEPMPFVAPLDLRAVWIPKGSPS
jgi:hypothetical protein